MASFRYPQFCAIARAAEILGHRWTLLILRNLSFGPQRFSDLKAGLAGISPSVLSQRLDELVERGVLLRRSLDPPAASTVYDLTPVGRALAPVMMELGRWGARFLTPPEPGDQMEPAWARANLVLFKRWEPSPEVALELRITGGAQDLVVTVRGGPDGTSVENVAAEGVQAVLRLGPATLTSVLLGHLELRDAIAGRRIELEGDASAAARLPELFDLDRRRLDLPSDAPATPSARMEGEPPCPS